MSQRSRGPRHARVSTTPKRPLWALSGATVGIVALIASLLTLVTPTPQAQAADWPGAGGRGTIQGSVYVDRAGKIDAFNRILGDRPLEGVVVNAMVVKSDGTVIADRNPDGTPKPFQVLTDENGFYSFNFRPHMEAAYKGQGRGDQVKLAHSDRVRVWPDDSNFEDGSILNGLVAKHINGGTRLTPISTLTLSWLGTTNYVHGSISNLNMAFRPHTERTADASDWGDSDAGKHFDQPSWKPTLKHDIPTGLHAGEQPYLCGAVYSDMTFRFDRWDGRGDRSPATLAKAADKPMPGVRIAMTTYGVTWTGTPEKKLVTRYDYTDNEGRFCIKWASMDEVKTSAVHSARMMLTIEPPETLDEARRDIEALKSSTSSSAYDGVTPLLEQTGRGLPVGFAAIGREGFQGAVRPVDTAAGYGVGYTSADVACEVRGPHCYPDLLWAAFAKAAFYADGADVGLIPSEVSMTPERYTMEADESERSLGFEISNVASYDPFQQVIMVPVGQDPAKDANWISVSSPVAARQGTRVGEGTIDVPANLPVGTYALYTYSSQDGRPDFSRLHDVDYLRITDTRGHYLISEGEQTEAITALKNGQQAAESVRSLAPGTRLFNAYEDMGQGDHKVYLVRPGLQVDEGSTLLDRAVARVESEGVQIPGVGRDEFTIAKNTEPGAYELVILNGHSEEVDRQPLEVTGPTLELDRPATRPGETVKASLGDLNPDTAYEVVFTPANGGAPIRVDVPAHEQGTASVDIAIPNDAATRASYYGPGEVTLVKKGESGVLARTPLIVSTRPVYGPQIILPGFRSNGDGLVGELNSWSCSLDADCVKKFHLPKHAHVYRIFNHNSFFGIQDKLAIFGQDPTRAKNDRFIPGKAGLVNDRYQWSFTARGYNNRNEEVVNAHDATSRFEWDKEENWFVSKQAGVVYYVVEMTLTDTQTGLADTKTFALWIAAGGVRVYGGKFRTPAAILEVGKAIPSGEYCVSGDRVYNDYKPSASNIAKPLPWPRGVTLSSNGCLSGTPEEITPGENFVDLLAAGGGTDQNADAAVNTIRVAVRHAPDEEPPTITATNADSPVEDSGRIEVTQGDLLGLTVTATDNTALQIWQASAERLPKGVTLPEAAPAVGTTGDAVRDSRIDFTSLTVAEDAEPGLYPVSFFAMDSSDNVARHTVTIEVKKRLSPPEFTDEPAPAGQVGRDYGPWTVPVTDADGLRNVQVTSGTLPNGVTLAPQKDGTYVLAGTPTMPGSFTVTLTATDTEGASSTHEYTLTISPAPQPAWADDAYAGDEITLEIGERLDETAYSFAVKTEEGYTPIYSVAPQGGQPDAASLPKGLHLTDAHTLAGTPTELDPTGTVYVVGVSFGAGEDAPKVEKTVRIKVVDTTAPQVDNPGRQIVRVGETLTVSVNTFDNSRGEVRLSEATCTGTDTDFPLTASGTTLTSEAATSDQIGDYTCSVSALDSSNNRTEITFPLTVRTDGPLLSVRPETQTVITPGVATEITPIVVEAEEGAELDMSECISALPSTLTWDPDTAAVTGTVSSLVDRAFECTVRATRDGKETTAPLSIHVDGPLNVALNENGHVAVTGRVGKPVSSPEITTDTGTALSANEVATDTLRDYGLTFNAETGRIEGTPTKATPDGRPIVVTLTGTHADGTFDVPVDVTIVDAATITGIPTSATVGQTFTPEVVNPEDGKTYTVTVCAQGDEECSELLVSGDAGTELRLPDNAEGTLVVRAQDSDGAAIATNTPTITITPIDLVGAEDEPIASEQPGGTELDVTVKNPTQGRTYVATLCKADDTECADPVWTSEDIPAANPTFTTALPRVGENGTSEYRLVLTEKGKKDVLVSKPITVTAGDAIASQSTLALTPEGEKTANGTDAFTVTVTLADANGNPVSNAQASVNASVSLDGAHLSPFVPGDQPGTYVAQLTSTKAGTATVTATLGGQAIPTAQGASNTATFVAGEADLYTQASNFEISSGAKPANGGTHTVTVTLADANGNPVTGKQAELAGSATGLDGATVGAFTESQKRPGTYTADVTSARNRAGTATVSVTLNGQQVAALEGANTTAEFAAGVVDRAKTTVTVNGESQATVNAGTEVSVVVEAKDADGNPVSLADGATVRIPGLDTPVALVADPDTPGRYTAVGTPTTVTSEATNKLTFPNHANLDNMATLDVTPGAATTVDFSDVPTGELPSGTEVNEPGTVTITDAHANPVANTPVWVKVPGQSDPILVTTDDDGRAPIPAFTPDATADNTITVYPDRDGSADTDNPLGSTTVTVVAGDPSSEHTTLTATPEEPTSGTPVTVTGRVADAAGNPVANRSVTVTLPGGQTVNARTNGSGEIVAVGGEPITYTAGQPDVAETITLHDGTSTEDEPLASIEVTPQADPSVAGVPVASESTVEVTDGDKLANGDDAHTITVTLKDAYGHPVTGANLSATGEHAVIGTFTEGADGTYTAAVTSTTPGVHEVSVNVGETAIGSVSPSFTVGQVDPASSELVIEPDSITAGEDALVTLTPKDAAGHVVTTVEGPLTVTVDGTEVTLSKQADGTWTGQVRGKKAGTHNVTTSLGETGPKGSLTVTPGAPATEPAADAAPQTQVTEFIAPSTPVKVGDEVHVRLTRLTDAYGNTVSPDGKLTATINGQPVDMIAGDDGTYTVAVPTITEGNQEIAFSYDGTPLGQPITVPVGERTAGVLDPNASTFTVTAPEKDAVANGTDAYTVTVTVRDRDGKPLAQEPTVTVEGLEPTVTPVASEEVGTYTLTVTSTQAGDGNVRVSINGTPIQVARGTSSAVTFKPGAPARATVPDLPEGVSGERVTNPGEATVTDENGNPVEAGTPVWVTVPGRANPVRVEVGEAGTVTIPDFTPGEVSDNAVIIYADKDAQTEIGRGTMTVTPGAIDQTRSSMTLTATRPAADSGDPIENTPVSVDATLVDSAGNPITEGEYVLVVTTGQSSAEIPVRLTDEGKVVTTTGEVPTFNAGNAGETTRVDLVSKHDQTLLPGSVTAAKDPARAGVPVFGESASTATITDKERRANGVDAHAVTVTLQDAYGDAVSGKADELALVATGEGVGLGDFTETEPGTYTASVTSTKAADIPVRVTLTEPSTTFPAEPLTATFVAGALSNEHSTMTVTSGQPPQETDTVAAGTPITVTVTPKDANGNVVPVDGDAISVNVPGVADPVTLTKRGDGSYVGETTPTTPATGSVAFDPTSPFAGILTPLTVTAGAPAGITGGTPLQVFPNREVPEPGRVTVVDAHGNPVGAGVAIQVSVPGANGPVEVTTDENGGITIPGFTPTDEPDQKITITAGSTPLGEIPVSLHAPVNGVLIEGVPSEVTAGDTVCGTGSGCRLVVTSDDGLAAPGTQLWVGTDSRDRTLVTVGDDGTAPIPAFVFEEAGDKNLFVFTDPNDAHVEARRAIRVIAGDPQQVHWPDTPITGTDGERTEIPAPTVTDSYGNPVAEGTQLIVRVPGYKDPRIVFVGPDGKLPIPDATPTLDDHTITVSTIEDEPIGTADIEVARGTSKAPENLAATDRGVTGEATPGASVTVSTGSCELTGVVGEDGTFTVPFTDECGAPASGPVSVTVTEDGKNPSASVDVEVRDRPAAPEKVTATPERVTVTVAEGTPDHSFVTVTDASGAVIGEGLYVENGPSTITIDIPHDKRPADGQTVSVTVTDPATDLTSDPTTATVDGTISDPSVAITHGDNGDFTLTITTDPDVTDAPVVCLRAPGSGTCTPVEGVNPAEGDNTWSVTIPADQAGSTVIVTVTDPSTNSASTDVALPPAPPAPTELAGNATGVTGVVSQDTPAGSTVTVTKDGQPVGTGTVADDHTFTIVFDPGYKPVTGDELSVVVTDKDTHLSSEPGRVRVDADRPSTPSVVTDATTPTAVTGTVDPGSTVTVCVGATCVDATVKPDGSYTAELPDALKTGDEVTVTATNPAGNSASAEHTVDFTPPATPTVTVEKQPDGSAVVTITPKDPDDIAGPPSVCITPAGATECAPVTPTPQPDGSYTVRIPTEDLDTDVIVTTTVTDAAGNTSEETTTVPATVTPEPIDVEATTVEVTGTADPAVPVGSAVTVTNEDGTVIGTATVDEDHSFTVTIPAENRPDAGDDVTVTVTDRLTGVTSPGVTVTVEETPAPAKPTVDVVTNPDGSVTITVTPDLPGRDVSVCTPTMLGGCTDAGLEIDGPREDGTYVITVPAEERETDTTYVVTMTDPASGKSSSETVEIAGRPDAPTDLHASSQRVSGKVDESVPVGSTVTVRDADGTVIGEGTVGEDHTFTVPYAPGHQPANGDTVTVTVTDKDTHLTSPAAEAIVDASVPSTPSVSLDDTRPDVVTGKTDAGTTVTVCIDPVEGEKVCVEASVDDEDTYEATLPKPVEPGDRITVEATNPSSEKSSTAEKIVEAKPQPQPEPTADPTSAPSEQPDPSEGPQPRPTDVPRSPAPEQPSTHPGDPGAAPERVIVDVSPAKTIMGLATTGTNALGLGLVATVLLGLGTVVVRRRRKES